VLQRFRDEDAPQHMPCGGRGGARRPGGVHPKAERAPPVRELLLRELAPREQFEQQVAKCHHITADAPAAR
jgi:hypothetical protein